MLLLLLLLLRMLRREGERRKGTAAHLAHRWGRPEGKEGEAKAMQRRRSAGEDADDEDVEEVEDVDVWLRECGLLGHRVLLALLTGRGDVSCCRYELNKLLSWRPAGSCLGVKDEGRERTAP